MSLQKPEPPKVVRSPGDRMESLFMRSQPDIDFRTPIQRYCNSLKEIFRMANIHFDDRNYEKAFILYHKYIHINLKVLPKHPEYNRLSREDNNERKQRSNNILEILEHTKNKMLMPAYQKEYDQYLTAQANYETQLKLYNDSQTTLADKRIEQASRERLERFQQELDQRRKQLSDPGAFPKNNADKQVTFDIVPAHIDIDNLPEVSLDDLDLESSSDEEPETNKNLPSAPPLPNVPDRSTKPTNLISNISDKDELSKMIVPFKAVTEKFMSLARSNTLKNVETCAILAGKLSQNAFTITHLLVPKQTGTSDTCSATNEEELFIEQEKHDLLTIGWIHTHPTQKAFLSSVDLHTHAPYQKMLPEAIAIVVAPQYDEIGLYSLSEYGLEFILKCKQTGFHPHPNESAIYGRAGHVQIKDDLDVQIVDFR